MCHRNLLGVPDPPLLFLTTLVTEAGTTSSVARSGLLSGRMTEQSHLTETRTEQDSVQEQLVANLANPGFFFQRTVLIRDVERRDGKVTNRDHVSLHG